MAIKPKPNKAKSTKLIKRVTPDAHPVHFQRLLRRKLGATAKEIALADGVSERVVSESINAAELYMSTHSVDYANAAVVGIVTDVSKDAQRVLKNALTAKIKKKNKMGRVVIQNDLPMQLKAVGHMTELVEAIQPRGKGIIVNANASAKAGAQSFSEENYQPGFEELIDAIRAKVERQNLVPREVSTTTDDVILEGELEDSAEEPDSRNEDDEPEDSAEGSP